jgi:hypothetical protein
VGAGLRLFAWAGAGGEKNSGARAGGGRHGPSDGLGLPHGGGGGGGGGSLRTPAETQTRTRTQTQTPTQTQTQTRRHGNGSSPAPSQHGTPSHALARCLALTAGAPGPCRCARLSRLSRLSRLARLSRLSTRQAGPYSAASRAPQSTLPPIRPPESRHQSPGMDSQQEPPPAAAHDALKHMGQPVEPPGDQPVDQPVDQLVDQPVDPPVDPPGDPPVDVDDSNNTTITAATVAPMPDFQQSSSAYNGYSSDNHHRPQTSYSDTAYQYNGGHGGDGHHARFSTPSDADTPPRHGYHTSAKETQMGQSGSRPTSQLGRYSNSEGNVRAYAQDQAQRSSQQDTAKNPSVVIKVGMVGDAQIGKTSLMVKYVEGSWDEDYIQTLGSSRRPPPDGARTDRSRRQLHGEDHLDPEHRDHVFHLGSRRPARVRQHAAARLQRRRRDTLHVRSDAQEHAELDQRVVSPRARL